jgi:hypothetical protein
VQSNAALSAAAPRTAIDPRRITSAATSTATAVTMDCTA